MDEERLGFVGIVLENRAAAPAVNEVLGGFGQIIRGRMGVPDVESGEAVICLVVRGTNNHLGALTGRL
ncbi:MAG: CopG family transcriptional regulator [Eubacteriales bacterium]|nr:CopG family transcriptional regulator [Eubacteriales bacterium]